ncbi:hypothetical protein CSPX01_00660 [Colletotrichum filicis]|nr:hypothetical protein CSPX01_00660 [Colletotrichum filicis]
MFEKPKPAVMGLHKSLVIATCYSNWFTNENIGQDGERQCE